MFYVSMFTWWGLAAQPSPIERNLSYFDGIIEHMFEILRSADDAGVLAAIEAAARAEAAAAAQRLAAVAELARRRCADAERALWACDSWDAAAAEVSVVLNVSRGQASGQMHLGLALFRRLPRVAELFTQGVLGLRVVSAIADRTALVGDDDVLAAVDEAMAEHASTWGPLSAYKLEQAIDLWVDRLDPGAVRRTRASARSRDVQIGGRYDESGTSSLWGRLFSADAKVLDRRLTSMAHGVCDEDPRTVAQRRADALGALAGGAQTLACRCGSPRCGAEGGEAASNVVIHVLAEAEALDGSRDPHLSGEDVPGAPFTREDGLAAFLSRPRAPEPEPTCPSAGGVVLGGGFLPGPMLTELVGAGATVRTVRRPSVEPEPGYRPSAALAEFIRMRDLTCRFPGCDVPADLCDIDHAIPWPHGPTHPSNLRCLCRKDHLLKTFWVGPGGWSDEQSPDGTIRWVSPTGQARTTVPGCRLLFPNWDSNTTPLRPAPPPEEPSPDRGHQMPQRRSTRLVESARRIKRERALNDARVAERNKPPPF